MLVHKTKWLAARMNVAKRPTTKYVIKGVAFKSIRCANAKIGCLTTSGKSLKFRVRVLTAKIAVTTEKNVVTDCVAFTDMHAGTIHAYGRAVTTTNARTNVGPAFRTVNGAAA